MSKSSNFLRNVVELVETGLISSQDLKKELKNTLRFKTEEIINQLQLVSREEFEVQKKLILKLQKELKKLKSKKKFKKSKRN